MIVTFEFINGRQNGGRQLVGIRSDWWQISAWPPFFNRWSLSHSRNLIQCPGFLCKSKILQPFRNADQVTLLYISDHYSGLLIMLKFCWLAFRDCLWDTVTGQGSNRQQAFFTNSTKVHSPWMKAWGWEINPFLLDLLQILAFCWFADTGLHRSRATKKCHVSLFFVDARCTLQCALRVSTRVIGQTHFLRFPMISINARAQKLFLFIPISSEWSTCQWFSARYFILLKWAWIVSQISEKKWENIGSSEDHQAFWNGLNNSKILG